MKRFETPTIDEFRSTGYTHFASEYPLSCLAVAAKAEFCGLNVEDLPNTFKFAPNQYCHELWEWLGEEKHQGRSIWAKPGWVRLSPVSTGEQQDD